MERRSSKFGTARGFSLVELMVAIALSLLLLTGVVAIFSSSRVAYESTDQLSSVQETGRFALEHLSQQIRSAGFPGCSRQPNYISTSLNDSMLLQWDFTGGPVRGYDANGSDWTPMIDDSITAADPNSDVLVLRGPVLDSEPARVTVAMAGPQAPLTVSNTANIPASGAVVMAYSCEAQSFFYAVPAGNTLTHAVGGGMPGNEIDTTNFPFRVNAEVVPVETVVYYVGPSEGAVPPNNTLPEDTLSLYRLTGVTAQELVQGVEQMQVEYGIDDNGDRVVDSYEAATAATNWQQVIAVRVALLVRSIQQYGTDTDQRAYQLFDTTITPPGDRRTRQVFTTTINIRNRARVE